MARATPAKKAAKVPAKKAAVAKPAKPAAKKAASPVKADAQVKAVAPKTPKAPEKTASEPKDKVKKPKLVRDSFTMPEAEYAVLGEVKKACLKAGIEVKKSELLRVGVALIRRLDTAQLKEILAGLPALKAGRPKKNK